MKLQRLLIFALVLLFAFPYVFIGCEGKNVATTPTGPTSNPTPNPTPNPNPDPTLPQGTSLVLSATPERSGTVSQGGTVSNSSAIVGDSAGNTALRGFLSYELGSIPSDAILLSAVLNLGGYFRGEGDPFEPPVPLGKFNIQCAEYGSLQGEGDFDGKNLCTLYSSTQGGSALASIDARAGLAEAFANGRERLQLRMFFDARTNGDGRADQAIFDLSTATLTVVYQ